MYTKTILEMWSYDSEFLPDELVAWLEGEVEEVVEEPGEPETITQPLEELSDIVGF